MGVLNPEMFLIVTCQNSGLVRRPIFKLSDLKLMVLTHLLDHTKIRLSAFHLLLKVYM